jgi:PAS domain S-box-containing protein
MESSTEKAGQVDADDAVLLALAGVLETAHDAREYVERIISVASEMRDNRANGLSYADIVTGTDGPLVIELVTEFIDGLVFAGSRMRRAEARALYAEGLTMEKISLLLRVSRQRISAIIRAGYGESIESSQVALTRSKALTLTDTEFRLLADAWPQIVWVVGPSGWAEYVNRVGTSYAGLSVEDICGRGWEAVVHPDDRVSVLGLWEQAVAAGAPFELEYRVRRFDGEFRSHLSRCAPIRNAAGVVTKWLGIATDVEDEKQLREDMQRAVQEVADARAMLESLQASNARGGSETVS